MQHTIRRMDYLVVNLTQLSGVRCAW
jgi:hypothetical protein